MCNPPLESAGRIHAWPACQALCSDFWSPPSKTRVLGCRETEGEREGPGERADLEDSPWLALVEGWAGGERGGLEDKAGLEDSPWLALAGG